jgi:hypothetical protein
VQHAQLAQLPQVTVQRLAAAGNNNLVVIVLGRISAVQL